MDSNHFKTSSVLSNLNMNLLDDKSNKMTSISVTSPVKNFTSTNEKKKFADDQENKPPEHTDELFKRPLPRENMSKEDNVNTLIDGLNFLKLGSSSTSEQRFNLYKWTTPLKNRKIELTEVPSPCSVENSSTKQFECDEKEIYVNQSDDTHSEYYDCSDDSASQVDKSSDPLNTTGSSFHSVDKPVNETICVGSFSEATIAEMNQNQPANETFLLEKYFEESTTLMDEDDFKLEISTSDLSYREHTLVGLNEDQSYSNADEVSDSQTHFGIGTCQSPELKFFSIGENQEKSTIMNDVETIFLQENTDLDSMNQSYEQSTDLFALSVSGNDELIIESRNESRDVEITLIAEDPLLDKSESLSRDMSHDTSLESPPDTEQVLEPNESHVAEFSSEPQDCEIETSPVKLSFIEETNKEDCSPEVDEISENFSTLVLSADDSLNESKNIDQLEKTNSIHSEDDSSDLGGSSDLSKSVSPDKSFVTEVSSNYDDHDISVKLIGNHTLEIVENHYEPVDTISDENKDGNDISIKSKLQSENKPEIGTEVNEPDGSEVSKQVTEVLLNSNDHDIIVKLIGNHTLEIIENHYKPVNSISDENGNSTESKLQSTLQSENEPEIGTEVNESDGSEVSKQITEVSSAELKTDTVPISNVTIESNKLNHLVPDGETFVNRNESDTDAINDRFETVQDVNRMVDIPFLEIHESNPNEITKTIDEEIISLENENQSENASEINLGISIQESNESLVTQATSTLNHSVLESSLNADVLDRPNETFNLDSPERNFNMIACSEQNKTRKLENADEIDNQDTDLNQNNSPNATINVNTTADLNNTYQLEVTRVIDENESFLNSTSKLLTGTELESAVKSNVTLETFEEPTGSVIISDTLEPDDTRMEIEEIEPQILARSINETEAVFETSTLSEYSSSAETPETTERDYVQHAIKPSQDAESEHSTPMNSSNEMDETGPIETTETVVKSEVKSYQFSALSVIPETNESESLDEIEETKKSTEIGSNDSKTFGSDSSSSTIEASPMISPKSEQKLCSIGTPNLYKMRAFDIPNDSSFNADYCLGSANRTNSLVSPKCSFYRDRSMFSPFCTPSRKKILGTPKGCGDVSVNLLDMSLGHFQKFTATANVLNNSSEKLNKTIDTDEPRAEEPELLVIEERKMVNVKTQTHNTELEDLRKEYNSLKDDYIDLEQKFYCLLDTAQKLHHNETALKEACKQLEENNRVLDNKYELIKEYSDQLLMRRNAELDEKENEIVVLNHSLARKNKESEAMKEEIKELKRKLNEYEGSTK